MFLVNILPTSDLVFKLCAPKKRNPFIAHEVRLDREALITLTAKKLSASKVK